MCVELWGKVGISGKLLYDGPYYCVIRYQYRDIHI
jgi:hypothetical protein